MKREWLLTVKETIERTVTYGVEAGSVEEARAAFHDGLGEDLDGIFAEETVLTAEVLKIEPAEDAAALGDPG